METVPELFPEVQNDHLFQNCDFPRKERTDDYYIVFIQSYVQIRFNKNPSCKLLEMELDSRSLDFILVFLMNFICPYLSIKVSWSGLYLIFLFFF